MGVLGLSGKPALFLGIASSPSSFQLTSFLSSLPSLDFGHLHPDRRWGEEGGGEEEKGGHDSLPGCLGCSLASLLSSPSQSCEVGSLHSISHTAKRRLREIQGLAPKTPSS